MATQIIVSPVSSKVSTKARTGEIGLRRLALAECARKKVARAAKATELPEPEPSKLTRIIRPFTELREQLASEIIRDLEPAHLSGVQALIIEPRELLELEAPIIEPRELLEPEAPIIEPRELLEQEPTKFSAPTTEPRNLPEQEPMVQAPTMEPRAPPGQETTVQAPMLEPREVLEPEPTKFSKLLPKFRPPTPTEALAAEKVLAKEPEPTKFSKLQSPIPAREFLAAHNMLPKTPEPAKEPTKSNPLVTAVDDWYDFSIWFCGRPKK